MHITQDQLVAARGLLRWPQKTLAKALEISATQICDYECGLRMSGERMNEIVEVLQGAGIIFLDLPEGRGVLLRKNADQLSAGRPATAAKSEAG